MILDKKFIITFSTSLCWILFGIWLTRDDPTHLFSFAFLISGVLGGLLGYWLIGLISSGLVIDQKCFNRSRETFHLSFTLDNKDIVEFRSLINRFKKTRNVIYTLVGLVALYILIQDILNQEYFLALIVALSGALSFLFYKRLFFSKVIAVENLAGDLEGKHELFVDPKGIADNTVTSNWESVFYHISQDRYIYVFSKYPWVFIIPTRAIGQDYYGIFNDSIACFRRNLA